MLVCGGMQRVHMGPTYKDQNILRHIWIPGLKDHRTDQSLTHN